MAPYRFFVGDPESLSPSSFDASRFLDKLAAGFALYWLHCSLCQIFVAIGTHVGRTYSGGLAIERYESQNVHSRAGVVHLRPFTPVDCVVGVDIATMK